MEKTDTRLKVYSILGWIFFLFPLIVMIIWIISVYQGSTEIERAVIFNSYFPEFMAQNKIIPVTSSVLSALSVIFSTMGLRAKGMTVINVFVIVLALLVFTLNIFSFM